MANDTATGWDWERVEAGTIVSRPRSLRDERRANEVLEARGLHLQPLNSGRRRVDPIVCVFEWFEAAS